MSNTRHYPASMSVKASALGRLSGGFLGRGRARTGRHGTVAQRTVGQRTVVLGGGCVAANLLAAGLFAAGVLLLTAGHAEAQRTGGRDVPSSRAAMQYSFAPIVRRAAPAVVNVYVRSTKRVARSPFLDDPFFREFFGRQFGPRARVQNSLGSGVIVDASGLIVTNAHVLGSSAEQADIRVVLADRREFKATVVLEDKKTDIAILRIETKDSDFPIVRFADSDAVEVGDLVLAIGNPFGVGQTVTSGIVSALARSSLGQSSAQVFIQTDAAINPGNSGGALVDMDGRLLGINTAIFSKSGGSLGIGFAIPANLVRLYVNSAMTGRKVERPWLGAKLESVTREIAEKLRLTYVAGALVLRVDPGTPAAEAGLRRGDIIVAVDDRPVADARATLYRLATRGVGNRVSLGLQREGRRLELTLALRAAPGPSEKDIRLLDGNHPLFGARVSNIRPALSDELDLEVNEGVVILDTAVSSTAAELGFRRGDVVLQVGHSPATTVDVLERLLKQRQRIWFIAVRRGSQILRLEVPG